MASLEKGVYMNKGTPEVVSMKNSSKQQILPGGDKPSQSFSFLLKLLYPQERL